MNGESTPVLTAIADVFASLLRGPGDLMRSGLVAIDVSVVKGIFIAYFVILIVWVMTLHKDEVTAVDENRGKSMNLRPYAIAALFSQVLIYYFF